MLKESPQSHIADSLGDGSARRPWGLAVVLLAAAAYVVLFVSLQLRAYEGLHMTIADLAYHDQALYNSLHGCLMCTSVKNVVHSLFTEHTHFVLFGVLPLYMLVPRTELLFVVQAIIIASGSVALYLIARFYLRREVFATVLALSYLLYPPLQWANLNAVVYGFHPDTFFPALFLFATYFLITGRRYPAIIFFALTLSVQEYYAPVVAGFGLFLALTDRPRRRFGILLSAFSLLWLAVAVLVLIPWFRRAAHFENVTFYIEALRSAAESGFKWPAFFSEAGRLLANYLWGLSFPVAFLPLGEPLLLAIIIPNLALNFVALLAGYDEAARINYSYHVSCFVPIVFLSMVLGMHRLLNFLWSHRERPWIIGYHLAGGLLALALLSNYMYGPVPGTQHGDPAYFAPLPEPKARNLQDLEKIISPAESLSATSFVGSHFTQRLELYKFPANWQQVDTVLIDVPRLRQKAVSSYKQVRACPDFTLVYEANGFELYQRVDRKLTSFQSVDRANFGNQIRLEGFRFSSKPAKRGTTLALDLSWRSQTKLPVSYTVFVHVVAPSGQRVAQSDGIPVNGTFPTVRWKVGEPVYDRQEIPLPDSVPSGRYLIQIGLYDLTTGQRLPILDALGNPRDSKLDLTEIEMVSPGVVRN